jgi:hypothetical protein
MKQHLSEDEMAQWLSGERLAEVERHLRECSQCAAEVEATERTFALFRESGLQQTGHWYHERPAAAPSPRGRRVGALTALAALCVVSCAVLLRPVPTPRKAATAAEGPFLEMPYVVPLAPYERVEVVRMDVKPPLIPFRVSSSRQPREWPNYQHSLERAPAARSHTGPDRSMADFVWCMTAIDWGFGVEATAERLFEENSKARDKGRDYALQTARNAHTEVEKNRAGQGRNRT